MGVAMVAERQKATPDTWMYPPEEGWSFDQVKDLELPFDWQLVDGNIVVRGMTALWHDGVRDGTYDRLKSARREPFAVNVERRVLIDERNVTKPDITVYDKRDLDFFTAECVPVGKVALVVEIVTPGSRQEDRVRKPAMFAEAKVPYYWRVERGDDGLPVVHELWLHHDLGMYVPAPAHPSHSGKLDTNLPFPVTIDLHSLVEL
ncbi:Uma2 family endonuclease [Streptomyces sp. MNU89]|uniref:Uma2 family endonuclease n=1 Tax=Streptomyces sp. MNU89 TaxID=2560025 RepID=UPI001E462DCD|nr:Uma2 family endonuclease [Streptomyces sp. MNU89]MCC9740062.1 Uma2 family endonuclease [Streptomyces sp. MNU89]